MTDITMYISADNGAEILILPIIPKNLPQIVKQWQHSEFTTFEKDLTLIGKEKKRTMELELLLPVHRRYRLQHSQSSDNGMDYIDFWQRRQNEEIPLRLIITKGYEEILNIAYTINSLSYYWDKKGDIICNLSISEYIFQYDQNIEKTKESYSWEQIFIEYEKKKISVKGSLINNRWLVPVRKVLELLGYTVEWNSKEKAIYYTKDEVTRKLDTNFEIYNGTSYSYIYLLGYELGVYTVWDKDKRTVILTDIV